jgi:hypothetical protein
LFQKQPVLPRPATRDSEIVAILNRPASAKRCNFEPTGFSEALPVSILRSRFGYDAAHRNLQLHVREKLHARS